MHIKRFTENNIKWEVNTCAIISPMKGLFVEVEVRDQKGVVFTGKDVSDLYANKMNVKDQQLLNMDFVICM